MFNKNELLTLIISLILGAYIIAFEGFNMPFNNILIAFLNSLPLALIILLVHVVATKITAFYFGCNAEFKFWEFRRYGLKPEDKLKFPFPIWILLPLLLVWLSWGAIKWFAFVVFDVDVTTKRIGRRFSDITEWDLAKIAAVGPVFVLIMALVARALGFNEFALLCTFFSFFSLIPIGALNGTKVFFGSKLLWIFLFSLTLITLILMNIAGVTITIISAVVIALAALITAYYFGTKH